MQPETLLVTLDVKFLYANIPHTDGIEACREALNTEYIYSLPTEDLIELTMQTDNNKEHLHLYWSTLLAEPWHTHEYMCSPFLCQHFHGQTREPNPG